MKKWLLTLGTIGASIVPVVAVVSCSSNAADSQSTTDHASEMFDGLFPTWPTMLATILSLLILLFVLTKFLYKPIKKSVEDRKKYIQDNIDEAEHHSRHAAKDREKANDELIRARKEAAEVITAAKVRAEKVRAEALVIAKEEADRLVKSAQDDIAVEKAKFEKESRQAIVDVALSAAAKIVEKEVDTKANKKMVEDFIDGK